MAGCARVRSRGPNSCQGWSTPPKGLYMRLPCEPPRSGAATRADPDLGALRAPSDWPPPPFAGADPAAHWPAKCRQQACDCVSGACAKAFVARLHQRDSRPLGAVPQLLLPQPAADQRATGLRQAAEGALLWTGAQIHGKNPVACGTAARAAANWWASAHWPRPPPRAWGLAPAGALRTLALGAMGSKPLQQDTRT
eukprot:CAMPEP_0179208556 /NCGR_PEP_ID=MMETSP0796-20121207/104009_1 /TAXON_ID=73915 /ORGANISM="Pyrodinium bahamense, Strain pbaha01" /LENGTH=195 /DNA_ID=CAMNT_0020913507 /DNA_START=107 /DNA_END=690 /DNA_ORIENTATION=+